MWWKCFWFSVVIGMTCLCNEEKRKELLFSVNVTVVEEVVGEGFVNKELQLDIIDESTAISYAYQFCEKYYISNEMCSVLITTVEEKLQHTVTLKRNNELLLSALNRTSLNSNELNSKEIKFPVTSSSESNMYSSFTCSSGNQEFGDWNVSGRGNVSFFAHRVCMLKNVCIEDNDILYYQHPEEVRAPEHLQLVKSENLLRLSVFERGPFRLSLQHTPLPSPSKNDRHVIDKHTWFLSFASIGYNYAHLLKDDMFPILTAMDLFNIKKEDARILSFGCDYIKGMATYFTPPRTAAQACIDNYLTIGKLLLGTEPKMIKLFDHPPMCFKQLVVGQGHVFSVPKYRPDSHQGIYFRRGRDAVAENIPDLGPPPTKMKVVVIPKHEAGHTQSGLFGPSFCDSVSYIINTISSDVEVECLGFSVGIEEEIRIVRTATLVVSEDGTVAYSGLFAHDGTVQIIVTSRDNVKECYTLTYATHIRVLFAVLEQPDDIPGTFRYGIYLAATNFNLV